MAPQIRRLTLTGLATLGVLGGGFALFSAPAIASLAFPFKEQLNGENTPPESFGFIGSVAVDETDGDVLVAATHHAVYVFDSSGHYVTTWTGSNTPSESFGEEAVTVAANNSTGEVYVTDAGDGVVDVFDSSGSYICQITKRATPSPSECNGAADKRAPSGGPENPAGVAVDQATGEVYVVYRTAGESVVDVFNSSGAYQSQITGVGIPNGRFTDAVNSVAVDGASHDVFIGDSLDNVVDVFNSSGVYLAAWTGSNTPAFSFGIPTNPNARPLVVAANNTLGAVFVADYGHDVVDEFASSGAYVGQITHTPSGPLTEVDGVAVDQASGDEYVIDGSTVDRFGPPTVLPTVVPGVPSGVKTGSARINGTVNPEGFDAHSVLFEFGACVPSDSCSTSPYGLMVAGSPADAGSGASPVPVSAEVTGLQPGAFYHYRLLSTNVDGTEESVDQRLITGPALEDRPASSVSQFAATLNATVEPGEVPTSYHFVYGTTAGYGSVAPVPDTELPIVRGEDAVSQAVTGLQAGTTYHFAVVASSSAGAFTGPDQTFTTAGIPAPLVNTGGPSGVTQSQATLAGAIDPQGWDTTYHFEYGTSTAYGSSWPTLDIDEGALIGSQPVSILLQNLSPNTTYQYRLVATNGGGTAYGADGTFTTAEYPPSIIQTAPVLGTFKLPSTAPPKPLTNAQKLANALKACKKQPKRQRASCKKRARERYGPVKKK
jgi:hypothetical protein